MLNDGGDEVALGDVVDRVSDDRTRNLRRIVQSDVLDAVAGPSVSVTSSWCIQLVCWCRPLGVQRPIRHLATTVIVSCSIYSSADRPTSCVINSFNYLHCSFIIAAPTVMWKANIVNSCVHSSSVCCCFFFLFCNCYYSVVNKVYDYVYHVIFY